MYTHRLILRIAIGFTAVLLLAIMLPSSTSAQWMTVYDNIPDPIPYIGGSYTIYLSCGQPTCPFCDLWIDVWSAGFITVDGNYYIYKTCAGNHQITANISSNTGGSRMSEINFWQYQWCYDDQYLDLVDVEYVEFYQETGIPTSFSCYPNPIEVDPPNATTVTFSVDVGNINVKLQYLYLPEGGQDWLGPYTTDSFEVDANGEWTLEYDEDDLEFAGQYKFLALRNASEGFSWRDLSSPYIVTLCEAPCGIPSMLDTSMGMISHKNPLMMLFDQIHVLVRSNSKRLPIYNSTVAYVAALRRLRRTGLSAFPEGNPMDALKYC